MNIYKNYISQFLQGFNSSQLALFIAILSMVFVVALKDDSRCLSAQCVAGANEVMAGDITIKSSNPNGTTLKSTSISDIDINLPATTGTLLHTASSLGNNQILQTDSSGNISTGTIPALDIDDSTKVDTTGGTSGQILKVGSTGGLEFANYEINETQFDSSNATILGQFLRSNVTNGLDFDTLELDDITVSGSANDEVRISALGELEIFTPSGGGGRWALVGSGQMSRSGYDVGACWYDDTQGSGIGGALDQTKTYKLVIEPTGHRTSAGNNGAYPYMILMDETNCSTMASSTNYLFSSSVTKNGVWAYDTRGYMVSTRSYVNDPWLYYQQANYTNGIGTSCGGASIEMKIRNGVDLNGASANTNNDGIKIDNMVSSAPCFDGSNLITGWQFQDNSGLNWDSSTTFGASGSPNMNDFTGIRIKNYDSQGGWGLPVWYLYESNH